MRMVVSRPKPPIHLDLRGRHPRVWRADIEAIQRLMRRVRK